MEPSRPSVFTPFLRRFTDERARDLGGLRALHNEVRTLHLRSKYADDQARIDLGTPAYIEFIDEVPEPLVGPFCGTLDRFIRMETTILDFPDIKWDVAQLSLKEQVDLERFLTAKRHFLTNEARVIALLQGGLYDIFEAVIRNLPQLSSPSPFTIPLIHTMPEPKKLLDYLYGIIWSQRYIDNGLFVDVGKTLHRNICAVSKIDDPTIPNTSPTNSVRE